MLFPPNSSHKLNELPLFLARAAKAHPEAVAAARERLAALDTAIDNDADLQALRLKANDLSAALDVARDAHGKAVAFVEQKRQAVRDALSNSENAKPAEKARDAAVMELEKSRLHVEDLQAVAQAAAEMYSKTRAELRAARLAEVRAEADDAHSAAVDDLKMAWEEWESAARVAGDAEAAAAALIAMADLDQSAPSLSRTSRAPQAERVVMMRHDNELDELPRNVIIPGDSDSDARRNLVAAFLGRIVSIREYLAPQPKRPPAPRTVEAPADDTREIAALAALGCEFEK